MRIVREHEDSRLTVLLLLFVIFSLQHVELICFNLNNKDVQNNAFVSTYSYKLHIELMQDIAFWMRLKDLVGLLIESYMRIQHDPNNMIMFHSCWLL